MKDLTPSPSALKAVSDAVLAVTSERAVEEVLQRLVDSARELASARYAALGLPDGEEGFSQFLIAGMSDELDRGHGAAAAHGTACSAPCSRRPSRSAPATSTGIRASAAGGRARTPTCARSSACRSSPPRA